jgi:uncharacterized protein YegL
MAIRFHFEPELLPISLEPHLAWTLVIDTSAGMAGSPINEVNRLLAEFQSALKQDACATGCFEISVITFADSVKTESDFVPAIEFTTPTLTTSGASSMNKAINTALDALEARNAVYRFHQVRHHRPWLFLFTNAAATDSHLENSTKARLQQAIQDNKVFYLPIGVGENADIAKLLSYYPEDAAFRVVLNPDTCNFNEAFSFFHKSMSFNEPGTEISVPQLPDWFRIEI